MRNKEISIIIPIYNAQKHLRRCLFSVKHQTFLNFECILIDDGSTDNSQKICCEFVNNDSRFIYRYKTNSGVSASRNLGMKIANAPYITFIDADDFVEENYLEELYEKTQGLRNPGICFCQYYIDTTDSCKLVVEPKLKEYKDISAFFDEQNLTIYDDVSYSNNIWGSVWRCLFSKSIIDNNMIEFCSKLRIHEDQVFLLEYLNKICAKDVVYVELPLYHYTIDMISGSALHRNYINDLFFNDLYYLKQVKMLLENAEGLSNGVKDKCYCNICFQNAYKIISQEQFVSIKKSITHLKQFCSLGLKEIVVYGLKANHEISWKKKCILLLYLRRRYLTVTLLFRSKLIKQYFLNRLVKDKVQLK